MKKKLGKAFIKLAHRVGKSLKEEEEVFRGKEKKDMRFCPFCSRRGCRMCNYTGFVDMSPLPDEISPKSEEYYGKSEFDLWLDIMTTLLHKESKKVIKERLRLNIEVKLKKARLEVIQDVEKILNKWKIMVPVTEWNKLKTKLK